MKENKAQRVLTSLLMGMNCVNGLAPLATLSEVDMPKPVPHLKAQDKQIEYTPANYQGLVDFVDKAVFGTAEASFITDVGTAFATSYVKGQTIRVSETSSTQNVWAGGLTSNCSVNNGGTQIIFSGGIASGGEVSSGGTQVISSGGSAINDIIYNLGYQYVSSGAYGSVTTLNGKQIISNGIGSVANGSGTQLIVEGTGYIDVNSGTQNVSGGTGYNISVISKGQQIIDNSGTGYITTMNGGKQYTLNQHVTDDPNGPKSYIGTMMGNAFQTVQGGGTCTITDMKDGWQYVYGSGASAYVSTMSGGSQEVKIGGSAAINVMSGGTQNLISALYWYTGGGSGTISTLLQGSQLIGSAATGTIVDMKNGIQIISSGGSTISTNVSGGEQIVLEGANISNNLVIGSGVQNISGTPNALSNNVIKGGGVQNISLGAVVTNQDVGVGGTQNVLVGGSAAITSNVILEGTQNVLGKVNIASGANQVVSGLTSVATGGSLVVEGTQTVTAGGTVYGAEVTSGGSQIVRAGSAIDTEIADGGIQIVSGGMAQGTEVASGGSQVVSGGTAAGTLLQTGAQQTIYNGLIAGQVVPTGVTQQLFGGTVDGDNITGGTVELYNNTAAFNNVTMSDGLIRFGADGGSYNVFGTFNLQGGLIDLTQNPDGNLPNPRTYETLTVDNLQGNDGVFKMDTDLDSAVYGSKTTYGDKIVIRNGTPGTHYIQVVDKSLYTGIEITGDRKLLLVTDLSGVQNLNYVGKDLNNGGVWHTLPPQLFKEGNKWYLGYIMKEPSNDTTTYITDRQVAVYNQWTRITNDSLRKRLGDLRYNDAEDGVWARFYKGKLSGDNFNQSYNTYQVGIDKTNGNSTYGLAIEKQETSQSYGYGNGDGTTVAGNIYYTKYTDTGSYFDAIFKYGKINSEYDTTGDFPDHADYDTRAYSLSLEYGKTNKYKNGYFFEPKIQLTYGNIGAEDYVTDRGTLMEESSIKSLIGKLGFVAGRKINDTSDYYFKAGIFREFKGERDVHLGAANGENMYKSEDYGDTWFELGLGGNVKIGKNTHVYGDIEKSIGADIQKDWQFNVGVRWEF